MKSDDDDEILNNLWNKNKNIETFLNTVFQFLRKKTNAFHQNSFNSEPTELIGLTTNIIRRWHSTQVPIPRSEESAVDTYNGGSFNGYSWSQTIQDLDIQVAVPNYIKKSDDIKINLSKEKNLKIEIRNQQKNWTQIVNDQLKYSVRFEALVWSLEPGKVIQLYLEKSKEMWWDALTISESPIDLQSIDASRPMEDLGQEEQMKIAELFWKNRNKRLDDQSN